MSPLLAALLLPSCQKDAPPPPPASSQVSFDIQVPSPSPVERVPLAMDTSVDPCEDFYRYACGGWMDATELPADEAMWVRSFSVIDRSNQQLLREILEDDAPTTDADLQTLRTWYASCMDEESIEARGLGPLRPTLDAIDAVDDAGSLMAAVGALHRVYADPFFDAVVLADFKDPETNLLYLFQGGLGLPDRDYYLEGGGEELQAAYRDHLAQIFTLLGYAPETAAGAAQQVYDLEARLAAASMSRAEMRDPQSLYRPLTPDALQAETPDLPWGAYFDAAGIVDLDTLSASQRDYLAAIAGIVADAEVGGWDAIRDYLRARAVSAWSGQLPDAFGQAHFAFYGATLAGQSERSSRAERCLGEVEGGAGELVGRYYVEAAFPGDSKQIALEMIAGIEAAFADRLPELGWMDDATRERAHEKMTAVIEKIGYPDTWRDYSGLRVVEGDFFATDAAARAFDYEDQIRRIGQPVDKTEWAMPPQAVNAYYNPTINEIVFPAGILQPPFFGQDLPMAMNYGAIGMVMGHELTHGFDDDGRKFDGSGALVEWWAPDAVERFEQAAACVREQYSTFEVDDGLYVNGLLTAGENIADLGGLRQAHGAWRAWQAQNPPAEPAVPGLTDEQLFFVANAQSWCALVTPELEQLLLTVDTHAPPRYRVQGAVMNFPAFGEAFACERGSAMRPKEICEVW